MVLQAHFQTKQKGRQSTKAKKLKENFSIYQPISPTLMNKESDIYYLLIPFPVYEAFLSDYDKE